MKNSLGKIVTGEYITATMLNFMAKAQEENLNGFVSAMFKNSGVLTSCGKHHEYSHELWVESGAGSAAKILAGSFVDAAGYIVNVPETQTSISLGTPTKIFIKHEIGYALPDVLITGSVGENKITYSSSSIKEYVEPGMQIITKQLFDAGQLEGYEVVSVGAQLMVKDPLPASFTNAECVIIPRFYSGRKTLEAARLYSFHKFAVADTASTGMTFSSDWVLLAVVESGASGLEVRNIRYQSADEIDDTEDPVIVSHAPNVASLATVFTQKMEYDIVEFMTNGILTIDVDGEDVTKDIFGDSHKQNTDIGTSNNYFDINTAKGIFRLGDVGDAMFLTRLYTNRTSKREYLLPSAGTILEDSTVQPLAGTNQAQEFVGTQAIRPSRTNTIQNYKLTLDGSSNFYTVPGGGMLQTIEFASSAVEARADGTEIGQQSVIGQFIILKPEAQMSIISGGNIISTYIPTLTQANKDNEDYGEAKGQLFSVMANEPVALVNMTGTWVIVGAAMSIWRKYAIVQQEMADMHTELVKSDEDLQEQIDKLDDRVTVLEERMDSNDEKIQKNKEDISDLAIELTLLHESTDFHVESLTNRVTRLETRADDHDDRLRANDSLLANHEIRITLLERLGASTETDVSGLKEDVNDLKTRVGKLETDIEPLKTLVDQHTEDIEWLKARINEVAGAAIPKGIVVALDITDDKVLTYFDTTGKGLPGGLYEGFHLCNGNGGTPNMQGRSLIMSNSYTGSSSSFPAGSGGGMGWPTTRPGTLEDGITNPTLKIEGSGAERMLGKFGMTMTWSQMPKHRHFCSYVGGDDGASDHYYYSIDRAVNALDGDIPNPEGHTGYSGNGKPFFTLSPVYVTLFMKKVE